MKHNKTQKNTFSENDYLSNDGMLTSVWGPSMWHYLHTMSFNYPVEPTQQDKKNYRNFVLSLKNVLPCGKCRNNLRKNFKKLPLEMKDMKSRYTFSKYIYDLHEVVNDMLGKKSGLTYEEIRERYEHFRARCADSYKKILSLKKQQKTRKHVKFAKKISVINEKGCSEPLYGEKSKCMLQIVPQDTKGETLQIDDKCVKQRLTSILKEHDKHE